MAGDQELLRVAELLRLCAATATLIGKVRPEKDRKELGELTNVVIDAADRLELFVMRTAEASDNTDSS